MHSHQPNDSFAPDGQQPIQITDNSGPENSSEELFLRNYDHEWSYDIEIEVETPEGTDVIQRRYYLRPGHTESISNVLTDGEYVVRVRMDNSERTSRRCSIDESIEHTAVVEVGNGALSLTEGLH
jgi:hypothetical protein